MLQHELIKTLVANNIALARQIRREDSTEGSNETAYSFIISGLRLLYPNINDKALKQSTTDASNDGGFDAIRSIRNKKKIAIFDFKYGTGFNYRDTKSFADNIGLYLFTTQQPLQGLSCKVQKRLRQARKYIKKGWQVDVYIIRGTQSRAAVKIKNIMRRLRNNYPAISCTEFFDVDGLVTAGLEIETEKHKQKWRIRIALGNNEPNSPADKILIKKRRDGPIKSMIVRLTLRRIVKLKHVSEQKGLNLFEANVRAFQHSRILSNKILTSIRTDPASFYLYHNGLTFSCTQIEKHTEEEYTIHDPQIVNGCQTVSTIYRAYRNNIMDKNLGKASILCRFYALESKDIEKVCEATNTQVRIYLWDLRSNDKIQRIFQEALKAKGIEYRRKKTSSKKNKVLITDLAQWLYSGVFKKPAEAKNKKASLFDLLLKNAPYDRIFNKKMSLNTIVDICEIAAFVEKKISRTKKARRSFERDADMHFIAGIYALRNKSWSISWKYARIKKIIGDVVRLMRKRHGRDWSYNRIFTKTEETWRLMHPKIKTL